MRVDEVTVPRPEADEVVIKVSNCGTDLHIVGGGSPVPNVEAKEAMESLDRRRVLMSSCRDTQKKRAA